MSLPRTNTTSTTRNARGPPRWDRLRNGLYVPAFLKRLHRDQRGLAWWPCPGCCGEPSEPCIICQSGTTPLDYSVVIADVGNDGCDCTELNGTYILSQTEANPCQWRYDFSSICNVDELLLTIVKPGADVELLVDFGGVGDGQTTICIHYQKTYVDVATIDCEFNNLDVPFVYDKAWCQCEGFGSTCTVTAA